MIHRWLLVCLVACGGAQSVKLEENNVTTLQVITGDGPKDRRICARGDVVEVVVTTKDGKAYYEGSSGAVEHDRFDPAIVTLTASIGDMNDRSWNPPDDAMAMLDKKLTITATLVANPSITSTIELEPHWKCWPPTAVAGGKPGSSGDAGAKGEAAGNAPRTTISIGYLPYRDGKLVAVTVEPQGSPMQTYLLDPTITMRVFAGGGSGGGGGGDGGDGGEVTVLYDAASPELAKYVVIDNAAGPGGDAGVGGHIGTAEDLDKQGTPGRDGRPGPEPRFVARAGISQLMEAARTRTAAAAPTEPIAKAPDDGARTYVGTATVTIDVKGRPPVTQTNRLEVLSTRTRKRHFTIQVQPGCVLAFNRSATSTEHVYALEAPTICEDNGSKLTIHRATLELDSVRELLSLTYDGKFTGTGKKPLAGTTHLEMKNAERR
ncbi:MAG: hypothetical protein M3619_04170 [Myxococcota bacterium]|nr:hypothetical protein [Myxococcota bacterium]